MKILSLLIVFLLSVIQVFGNQNCLVSHYLMEGNTIDQQFNFPGIGNNIIPTTDRHGNPSGAMYFSGMNSYVDFSTDFDYQERTVSLWFNAASINNIQGSIYNSDHSGINYGNTLISVLDSNGVKGLRLRAGGKGLLIPISENTWYMATITVDNSTTSFYLNDSLYLSVSTGFAKSSDGSYPAYLGKTRKHDRYFNGSIDDVRIYDCVLSSQSVKNLFDTGCKIAEYDFDQNAQDATLNMYNGLETGVTPAADPSGTPGKAFEFNGYSSFVLLPSKFDFPKRSINVWFKANSISTGSNIIFNSDDNDIVNGNTIISCVDSNSTYYLKMIVGSKLEATPINLNQWYMASITVDGAQVKYYLNGQLLATKTQYFGYSNDGIPEAIVGAGRKMTRFFDGTIDDLSIYACTVDSTEIQAMYSSHVTGQPQMERANPHVTVYPNPTAENISLQYDGNPLDVQIYNSTGELVKNIKIRPGESISLKGLSDGMYFIYFKNEEIQDSQKMILSK